MSDVSETTYTIEQYLFDAVNFDISEGAVKAALMKRGIDGTFPYDADDSDNSSVELAKADIYKWIVLGPSRVGAVSDSDNGWSHSGGSYTLSEADKKLLTDEANAIYEANGEEDSIFGKMKIRVRSMGIMGCHYTAEGRPLPRIEI